VVGSLWRRAQGKLFLSDNYLQNFGALIDRGQQVRRRGAKTVGQEHFQRRNTLISM
jgi:hypothetical protein